MPPRPSSDSTRNCGSSAVNSSAVGTVNSPLAWGLPVVAASPGSEGSNAPRIAQLGQGPPGASAGISCLHLGHWGIVRSSVNSLFQYSMKRTNEKVTEESSLLAGQGVQQVPQFGFDLVIVGAVSLTKRLIAPRYLDRSRCKATLTAPGESLARWAATAYEAFSSAEPSMSGDKTSNNLPRPRPSYSTRRSPRARSKTESAH